MNKVIDVDGYRLFQSSFDSDEQGTVLSVSYDRPGMQLTYTGYFLLLVGFVLTLFSKKSRFGRLRKELGEMKRIPFLLIALSDCIRHFQCASIVCTTTGCFFTTISYRFTITLCFFLTCRKVWQSGSA